MPKSKSGAKLSKRLKVFEIKKKLEESETEFSNLGSNPWIMLNQYCNNYTKALDFLKFA